MIAMGRRWTRTDERQLMLPGFVRGPQVRWIGDLVAELVAEGASWRDAARSHGLSLRRAYTLGTAARPDLLGRRGRVPAETKQAIAVAVTETEASYRQIARQYGVSVDTVHRVAIKLRGPVLRRVKPHRCGGCGAMIVTRSCVACEIRGGR